MTEVTAQLRSLHIAPRKVRLVVDRLRGKSITEAKKELSFRSKVSTIPLGKLIDSALANAKSNTDIKNPEESMYIKKINVDEGRPFKRYMPRARGRASMYKKRTSHITLILDSYDS